MTSVQAHCASSGKVGIQASTLLPGKVKGILAMEMMGETSDTVINIFGL